MQSLITRVTCAFYLALSISSVAQAQVAVAFDGSGLASLKFNGSELLSSGALRVNRITFPDGAGGTTAADLGGSVTVDAATGEIRNTYSWGTVSARYQVHGNRLDMEFTVTNRGTSVIQGVFLEPLELRLPSKPVEYDNVTPIMVYDQGEPGVLALTTTTTTVVLGYDDPGKPILAGFPWANDRPTSTVFPLRINTDRDPGYPDFYQAVTRPIAPGSSDQYHFSLRFGGAGSTATTLAADVVSNFAAKFPQTLRWTDKRPIGQLVLATSVAGYPTNPRGWLLDRTIDTTTPAGRAAFKTKIMAWADQSVAILTALNAQGMITWDIEGEEYPHPTTYLCDPRVLSRAAPEMDAIADEYFRKFTAAGLRVGVCIRPQSLVQTGQTVSQEPSSDPGQVLIDKIAYAKARWGASLFYMDSNGDPNLPLDADIIQRVTAAHPDVLIIPEHENTRYFAYTAPYRELRQNQVSTPDRVRLVYPSAFGVTYVADGDFDRYFDGLASAVQRGDSLMTRAWYPDPANAVVQRIYALAPPSPSPPAVSMTSPLNGAVVSGTITLSASATSVARITFAQFQLNGGAYGTMLASPPFTATLDTTTLADGPQRIGVRVRDENNNDASAEVTVTVRNIVTDAQPPLVTINTPATGVTVSGVVAVLATASDNVGVTSVGFQVDGSAAGGVLTAAPYAMSWNTAPLANGVHTLTATARDAAGNQSSTEVRVTVTNITADTQAPAVAITAPAAGARVAGIIQLVALATDNVGVTSVQFLVDGSSAGPSLPSAPYSLAWNSAGVADGPHTVTAVARDAAGNSAASTARPFVTANTSTAPATCNAVPSNAFLGCYYNRLDFGELFSTRIDPVIDFNWGDAAPMPGMRTETYTIRWQGQFAFAGGDYQFVMNLDDGARLYIDGVRVWDVWGEHWAQRYETTLRIAPGTHVVRLDYVNFSGKAVASLSWSPPGSATVRPSR